jgi:magnesium-transporting ATPase (P-type)
LATFQKSIFSISRGEIEEKSEFLGLIVMQNLVKEETYPAIKSLHEAEINTVMVSTIQFFLLA